MQALPDTKLLDSSFSIISAEKKCIFLELKVPSKVLEDKVLFRVALRALIVKIARAGEVNFNWESTITLHLTFNDELTEGNVSQHYYQLCRFLYIKKKMNTSTYYVNETYQVAF